MLALTEWVIVETHPVPDQGLIRPTGDRFTDLEAVQAEIVSLGGDLTKYLAKSNVFTASMYGSVEAGTAVLVSPAGWLKIPHQTRHLFAVHYRNVICVVCGQEEQTDDNEDHIETAGTTV